MNLLYESEEASTLLIYRYEAHTWEWDCKFWIVGNKICADLEGKHPLGELDEEHIEMIEELTPIIEQREKENRNWIAFNKCRKKTCVCKDCMRLCNCEDCIKKKTVCDRPYD